MNESLIDGILRFRIRLKVSSVYISPIWLVKTSRKYWWAAYHQHWKHLPRAMNDLHCKWIMGPKDFIYQTFSIMLLRCHLPFSRHYIELRLMKKQKSDMKTSWLKYLAAGEGVACCGINTRTRLSIKSISRKVFPYSLFLIVSNLDEIKYIWFV